MLNIHFTLSALSPNLGTTRSTFKCRFTINDLQISQSLNSSQIKLISTSHKPFPLPPSKKKKHPIQSQPQASPQTLTTQTTEPQNPPNQASRPKTTGQSAATTPTQQFTSQQPPFRLMCKQVTSTHSGGCPGDCAATPARQPHAKGLLYTYRPAGRRRRTARESIENCASE